MHACIHSFIHSSNIIASSAPFLACSSVEDAAGNSSDFMEVGLLLEKIAVDR